MKTLSTTNQMTDGLLQLNRVYESQHTFKCFTANSLKSILNRGLRWSFACYRLSKITKEKFLNAAKIEWDRVFGRKEGFLNVVSGSLPLTHMHSLISSHFYNSCVMKFVTLSESNFIIFVFCFKTAAEKMCFKKDLSNHLLIITGKVLPLPKY